MLDNEGLKHVNKEISYGIKEFVKNVVFGDSEYLFYNNKVNSVYCSKCEVKFNNEWELKHNEGVICSNCGANVQVKNIRYGRKNTKNEACFYYFDKSIIDKDVVVAKGYYVSKEYVDYEKPRITYELLAVYVFKMNDKQLMYAGSKYGLNLRSSIFDFNIGYLSKYMCYCSFESIKKTIKGTGFEYIPISYFKGHQSIVKLFAEYAKYPWIEYLCKMGLKHLVEAKINRHSMYRCLNYKEKDIFKILRLPKNKLKELQESKVFITPKVLKIYQLQVADKSGFSPKEVEAIIERYDSYQTTYLEKISKNTQLKKAINYLEKQKLKKFKTNSNGIAGIYSDYLDNCLKLEFDMKSKSVLYPKNVYKAHDNTVKQIKVTQDIMLDEKIFKRLEKLSKNYGYSYKELIIRPAESTRELIEEGGALKHCVATNYTEKYAKGETTILLIRKISELDTPYYTVEVRNNMVIQVQGKAHIRANKEVEEFMDKFKEDKLNKKIKKVA